MRSNFNRCGPSGFAVLGREVDQILKQLFPAESVQGAEKSSSFHARACVAEFEDRFEISVDLPGVRPSDVSVEFENEMLTIAGQRAAPVADENRQTVRDERVYGEFKRVVKLSEVDGDQITAEFKNGELNITAQKIRKPAGKKVEIKIG